MTMMLRRIMLMLGALTLAACAQAAATPLPDTPPLQPLPPVSTAAPGLAGDVWTPQATATTTTLPPSNELTLVKSETIGGDIAPKSVVATGKGLFFAQNMMYRHTITVYNRDRELVATIPDTVDLSAFGFDTAGSPHQGAPVEAVATSDGAHVYVSNYRMFGTGYANAGDDTCENAGWDESFVYRIAADELVVDQVIPVGAVPKYLALTPDDGTLLVTNWCSFDLSAIDTASGEETARVPLGRHPRGIAITGDGSTAYVAVMGSADVAIVQLATFEVGWIRGVGNNPRHLVLSPDDRYLYATLNGDDRVVRIDLATHQVVDRVATGDAPRSMTISDDGRSLYVVNYESDTLTKLDASTMTVLQDMAVARHPIGATFDNATRSVWVASYSGLITIFSEQGPAQRG